MAGNNQIFVIDQAASFSAVAFLECNPKMVFGQRDRQDTTVDGTPKWEVQVIAGMRDRFDPAKSNHETLKISINQHGNPGEGLAMYTPIHIVGLTVGVTPVEERTNKRTGEKEAKGGNYWFAAQAIQSALAAPSPRSRASADS